MDYLVIGSGVAGISAVKEILKKKSSGDNITIISDEKFPFYYRPRLIEYLSGEVDIEDIIINDKNWFKENNIDLHLGETVKEILTDEKKIVSEKNEYNYDKLLLANGAHPFVPPITGVDSKNVFTLRKAVDAKKIYNCACDNKKAVVIGGGLLGLESAYNLAKLGLEVVVLERGSHLLQRQLDEKGAEILQNNLEKKGLEFKLNASTSKIIENKNLLTVILEDGRKIKTELILLSTGVRSNIDLFKNTPIKVNKGVVVNEKMETNIKDIYAAGDVAEYNGRVYGIWPPSMKEGQIAGKNISGVKSKFDGFVSSYSLKVADISVVSKGAIKSEGNKVEIKKSNNKYKKLVYNENELIGAILIGDIKDKNKIISKVK